MSQFNRTGSKKPNKTLIILSFAVVCILIYTFAVVPSYISTSKNVIYSDSLIPLLLFILKNILEAVISSLLIAFTVYGIYIENSHKTNGERALIPFFGFFASVILLLFKFGLNIFSAIISGDSPEFSDILLGLIDPLTEIVILLVVTLVADNLTKKHFVRARELKKASKYVSGVLYDERDTVYPFKSFLDLKNVILCPIFIGVIILTFTILIQRIITDIGLGAPTHFDEVKEMVIYYLCDIIEGIITYTAAYFAASFLLKKYR